MSQITLKNLLMSEYKYTVVTVSDRTPAEDYYCPDKFYKSLANYGVGPLVLSNERMGATFNGLGSKPNWQCRAIKEGMIETPYVMFVDSWDLFFGAHPDKVFQKYLE